MSTREERMALLEEKRRRLQEIRKRREALRGQNALLRENLDMAAKGEDEIKQDTPSAAAPPSSTAKTLEWVKNLDPGKTRYKPPGKGGGESQPAIIVTSSLGGSMALKLGIVSLDTVDIFPDIAETYSKDTQVDTMDLAFECDILNADSSKTDELKAMYAFASTGCGTADEEGNGGDPWPPREDIMLSVSGGGKKAGDAEIKMDDDIAEEDMTVDQKAMLAARKEAQVDKMYMDEEASGKYFQQPDFREGWERCSKFMERAMSQMADDDIFVDYSQEVQDVQTLADRAYVTEKRSYAIKDGNDPCRTGDRPITSLAWSSTVTGMFLASYAEPRETSFDIPAGLVCVWTQHLSSKPEFMFTCESMVTVAEFHPTQSKLVMGATLSGQIVFWDMREKSTPYMTSSFSAGHNQPVFALKVVPSKSRMTKNILTVSTDARLCVWRDDQLINPSHDVEMKVQATAEASKFATTSPRDDICTSCVSFPMRDSTKMAVGSEDGTVYRGPIYPAGNEPFTTVEALPNPHNGPITNITFHPMEKQWSNDIGMYFLTSSYDWTSRLWDYNSNRPIATFSQAKDYVHDIQWSPVHPAVFGQVDGTGTLQVFNLNSNMDIPIVNKQVGSGKYATSRLRFSPDGSHVLVGDANGDVYWFDCDKLLYEGREDEAQRFSQKLSALKKNLS